MNYTKAQMLIELKEKISGINILPICVIKKSEVDYDKDATIKRVLHFAGNSRLIVRSSSSMEDTSEFSNAGKFVSIPDVSPDESSILSAVESVYKSYNTDSDEEILIQPMLNDVRKSGVIFTRDIDTNAEYYVVNYFEGKDTAAVTAGTSNALKTYVSYKKTAFPIDDADMSELISVVKEIELYVGNDALDIEFAISSSGIVYILQCRPIAKGKKKEEKDFDIGPALNIIYKKAQKLSYPHPFLLGETTCFGVMPDWNPAEILGVRPRKLAISLYKELVTDSVWAHQRADYGYRDLTMHPLMISFCGIPYIDTRITFNSFIPQKLNKRIAEKLANYYLDTLSNYPKYHDKIEFEIVYSCYYLGLPNKLKKLLEHGFNENEITRIEFSLLELTNAIINPKEGLYIKDIEKVKILEKNYERIENSNISIIDRIYWHLEECKRYGTLPFAGVARAAFVAVQFLKSFVDTGIITDKEYELYMNSLETINKRMNSDLEIYYKGELSKDTFLEKYGHIRPGTYDILSKRYDESFDEYFSKNGSISEDLIETEEYSFSEETVQKIQLELEENGLQTSAEELLRFIKSSIEGREYVKYVFTKSVSRVIQLIGELGVRTGISKEDLSHLDISVIRQLYVDLHTGSISDLFMQNICGNKEQYEIAKKLKLPSIIVRPRDIYSFFMLEEEPNFITHKNVSAEIVVVDRDVELNLEGKIVFIQSADPGYDYVFAKNIAGLVTQFGGANSHMAIRCAELGIPAVIGVGESRYNEWSRWYCGQLDCLKKQMIRIK